ncbi:MAG: InlB B-repeat-containing protein [Bacilli bacterium]|nr:InlB B-repeat-containing protein [Bacilli bacterium]
MNHKIKSKITNYFLADTKSKKTKLGLIILGVMATILAIIFGKNILSPLKPQFRSILSTLENDVEVQPKSELIYYLNISYDGVDKNGVQSSDTTISEITSGTIFIEDKIPEGLIFIDFVTTNDGSIGAVKRSDGSLCTGKVVDDTNEESMSEGVWNEEQTEYTYHGLHYNAENRTVSFQVKNLKAGCKLTVGIITKTPPIDDSTTPEKETRRDFYNFASARERTLTINSNTVHVFMGEDEPTIYNVIYEYTGTVPENAPLAPSTSSYIKGAKVGVASSVEVEGYAFSGWETTDATISNNSFYMPEQDVTLRGSFTPKNKNSVSYTIEGTAPEGYVLPRTKEYPPGTVVNVDSLKEGDIINGYRFLGWASEDITISEDRDFTMPASNVTLVGRFEEVTYHVTYQFYDGVLPPNAGDYLPAQKSYKPGDIVTIEDVLREPVGYKFLGWYKEEEFEMPEEDVIIYGEWQILAGTFEPTISKTVIGNNNYYRVGDVIRFKITITNTADFPIKNIMVKEDNDNTTFELGEGYEVTSDHIATIESLATNESIDLYASYTVLKTDHGTIYNTAEIKGALADNNYQLEDKEYKGTTSFKIQSQIKICKQIDGLYNDNKFQFHITGVSNHFDTWVVLEKDECETIYVDPSTYKITEIVPQEYTIKSITGLTSNGENLLVEENNNYIITFTNEFVKKGFFHSFGRVENKVVQGG